MKKPARVATAVVLSVIGAVIGLKLALLYLPGAGPALADALRGVLGTGAVTKLEEVAAKVEDRFKRSTQRREPPRSLDQVLPVPAARPSPWLAGAPASPPSRSATPSPAACAACRPRCSSSGKSASARTPWRPAPRRHPGAACRNSGCSAGPASSPHAAACAAPRQSPRPTDAQTGGRELR